MEGRTDIRTDEQTSMAKSICLPTLNLRDIIKINNKHLQKKKKVNDED